jgi:hypothetical protein
MFLGLTRGRAGGYGLVGACVDVGGKVDELAGRENENGVRLGIDWVYWGDPGCAVGHREA